MGALLDNAAYCDQVIAPLGDVIVAMEEHGVPFDMPAAQALLAQVRADELELLDHLEIMLAEFGWQGEQPNWGSWQQLQKVVYGHLGLAPSPYWKKGRTGYTEDGGVADDWEDWQGEPALKTDDKALEWLAWKNPGASMLLGAVRDLRWVRRARAYLEKWTSLALWDEATKWWWLHPSFGLAGDHDNRPGAVTGRFAVKNPALQQVPQDPDPRKPESRPGQPLYCYYLRRLFAAPPGFALVVVDYSQLELVVLAHLCMRLFGTAGLATRLQPGQPDMHSATAKYVFGDVLGDPRIRLLDVADIKKQAKTEREIVKPIRYGLNYGKGPAGFGHTLFLANGEALGVERAQQVIDALLAFDPEIRQYQEWVRSFIEAEGGIASLLGRWLPLPDARTARKGLRNRAWRRALNYPMQAGSQEICAAAMIRAHADPVLRRLGARLFLQVHDELVMLVRVEHAAEAMARLVEIMIETLMLDLPLAAAGGIGPNWGEAKG